MASHPQFSYEFFPPRTPVMEHRLWRAMGQLERLDPLFYSMTYEALGSAQAISVQTAMSMQRESPVPVAAHLTAADATRDTVEKVTRNSTRAAYAPSLRSVVTLVQKTAITRLLPLSNWCKPCENAGTISTSWSLPTRKFTLKRKTRRRV